MVVRLDKTNVGPFDVRVRLDGRGEPEEASVATQDGKLKALLKPDREKYLIDASARTWTLPVGPALVLDELLIRGVATLHDASLAEISARLHGGTAVGRMNIR